MKWSFLTSITSPADKGDESYLDISMERGAGLLIVRCHRLGTNNVLCHAAHSAWTRTSGGDVGLRYGLAEEEPRKSEASL